MIELRNKLEQRILWILKNINHPITSQIQSSLSLFSVNELSQIWEFLETGSLNPIYNFLEDKKQAYLKIINNLKIQERYAKLQDVKIKERLETEEEKMELIDFNF